MKKIKVLQVVGSLRVGGTETVALNYYKYIDRKKFEFDYLVYGNEQGPLEEEVYKLNGKVLRVCSPKKNLLKFLKDINKILKNNESYDVVHSHPLFNSGWIMKKAYKAKIPIRISHAHSARYNVNNNMIKKLYIYLMKRYMNRYSTNILACSKDAGNYLFGKENFKHRGEVIKNGICVKEYIFNEKVREEIRKDLELKDELIIGHIGRLCDVKNQQFIIELLDKLVKIREDIGLVLVGDGENKEKLLKRVKDLGLERNVKFLGTRNDVNRILQGMDILVFPSKYEGLGIVVVEAQCTGVKCIISDAIPRDVDITNLVSRLPIDQGMDKWIREVVEFNQKNLRRDRSNEIIENGYEIDIIVKEISRIYEKSEINGIER